MIMYIPLVDDGAYLIEAAESESHQNLDEFIKLMQDLVKKLQAGYADLFPAASVNALRHRFDETGAARQPISRWRCDDISETTVKQSVA